MNWNNPTLASTKSDLLTDLKSRDVDAYTWAESPTNPPVGAKRWVTASNKIQEWNGSSWVDKVLSIDSGGTGASSASTARTALGLGTLSTQNSNAVSISGGTISGLTTLGTSGNTTVGGILIAGSGPTTLTNSAGQVLEAAIADGTLLARNAGNESITGIWTFSNNIIGNLTGSITGNAATVTDGAYLTVAGQNFTGRKLFSAAQTTAIGVGTGSLGGLEILGNGSGASFLAFHRPGSFAAYLGVDTDNQLKFGGWSVGAVAYPVLLTSNYNSYAPTLTGVGATGTWNINVTGNAGTASVASSVAGTNITGATLAAGVTNSSLTTLGTLSGLTLANGSAASPTLRFSSNSNAGMYYNPSNPTVEFGVNFNDSSTRGVVRGNATTGIVDVIVGSATVVTFTGGGTTFGTDINPVNNTKSVGTLFSPWNTVYAVNGTVTTSDERHKRNHGAIEFALPLVRQVDTFVASWKQGPDHLRFPAFSAQNVNAVIDSELRTEVVKCDRFDMYSMSYERMIPVLWAAVRELDAEVQALRCN